jgi:phosphatidylglycerol:prolipoprotein diacylglycerol transferase
VASVGCDAVVGAEPQALGVTHWFTAVPNGEPYQATVCFEGHRLGPHRTGDPRQSFAVSETVERVVPGSGPVAVTARVFDVAPGEWTVTATVTTDGQSSPVTSPSTRPPPSPTVSASGPTGFAPLIRVRAPGVRLGAWPAFVSVGVGVAVTVQSQLAARAHLSVASTVSVSLVASLMGLVGARLYYLAEERPRPPLTPATFLTAGMCIQGFLLAALPAAVIGMLIIGAPIGRFLDATAPGVLLGMAIGRLGCFFGGCCVGRPTASPFGMWSSDRRVGVRRIPTQLLEAAVALAIGVAALLAVLTQAVEPPDIVFPAAMAAYTLGRQLLFPWRDLPRRTAHGRTLALAVTIAVVLADIVVVVLA